MMNFIITGQIPGTQTQLTFEATLIVAGAVLFGIYLIGKSQMPRLMSIVGEHAFYRSLPYIEHSAHTARKSAVATGQAAVAAYDNRDLHIERAKSFADKYRKDHVPTS